MEEEIDHSTSHPWSIPQKLLQKISKRSQSDGSESGTSSYHLQSPTSSPLHSMLDIPGAAPEAVFGQQDSSPGTRSPSPLRTRLERQTTNEQAYRNEPRYRKYVQLVEKNMASFEAVNEWADIISFLGRLLKSFQAYPQFAVIPCKTMVAKRLAQCLNPGFPAGVHQKTLEVYAYIFQTIGSDQLAEDLAIWSTGLFPFVQHAATHVKPQLLDIFEKFYFPLRGRLRPAIRGLTIALLAPVEEEGSEFFDQGISLLDRLAETVDLPFFYSSLWLIMIHCGSLRSPSLNYLLRRFPKLNSQEEVAATLAHDENISLMIRAFSATLTDPELLVQRNMLELLVQNVPLQHRTIPHDDLVILMRAALSIVLRKDMSLNRRLYAWLLGTSGSSETQLSYFYQYTEKSVTQAIRSMLFLSTNTQQDTEALVRQAQKPYKVLISLMDRWEIGQPVVSHTLCDSLISLQSHMRQESLGSEVLPTANMWMDMVEPYLIWKKLFELMDTSFPGRITTTQPNGQKIYQPDLDNLRLIEFALTMIKFSDEEVDTIHLPLLLVAMTRKLQESISLPSFLELLPLIRQFIQLIVLVLKHIRSSTFVDRPVENVDSTDQFHFNTNAIDYAREFYGTRTDGRRSSTAKEEDQPSHGGDPEGSEDEGDLSLLPLSGSSSHASMPAQMTRPDRDPIHGVILVETVISNLTQFLVGLVDHYFVPPDHQHDSVDVGADGKRLQDIDNQLEYILHGVCTSLTAMAKHMDAKFTWNSINPERLMQTLLICCGQGRNFGAVDAGLSTVATLAQLGPFACESALLSPTIVQQLMDKLWSYLSPSTPFLHTRAVELIWTLTNASQPHLVETTITRYLISEDDAERSANFVKFGFFWRLSEQKDSTPFWFGRPLCLVLDLLRSEATPEEQKMGETWIRYNVRSYTRVLESFLPIWLNKTILRRQKAKTVLYDNQSLQGDGDDTTTIPYSVYLRPFDTATVDYMLTTMINLIQHVGSVVLVLLKYLSVPSEGTIASLVNSSLGISVQQDETGEPVNYLELLVLICLRFLETEPAEHFESMTKQVRSIQIHAVDMLHLILTMASPMTDDMDRQIQLGALHKLLYCISTGELDLQLRLLRLVQDIMATTASNASVKASDPQRRRMSGDTAAGATVTADKKHASDKEPEATALIRETSDLYIKCLTDALILPSNRPLLLPWVDLALVMLPHSRGGFRHMVVPVLLCMCEQITQSQVATSQWLQHGVEGHGRRSFAAESSHKDNSDPEHMIIFLDGFERLMLFCLSDRSLNDHWFPTDKSSHCRLPLPRVSEQTGLKALELLVHSNEPFVKPRETVLYYLPMMLHSLVNVWKTYHQPEWNSIALETVGCAKKDAIVQGFSMAAGHVNASLLGLFEKLYKACPAEYVEGFTEVFFVENPQALEYESSLDSFDFTAMEILSTTQTSAPQHILSLLLHGIRQRTLDVERRKRPILRTGKLTDTSMLRFAEIYCTTHIAPEQLSRLWTIIQAFAKEYLAQAATHKILLPGLLRFLTIALKALVRSKSDEDKRLRKDAQDLYQRCADFCILIAGRSFDQSLWLRRPLTGDDDSGSNSLGGLGRSESSSWVDTKLSELPRSMSMSTVSDLEMKTHWRSHEDNLIAQVNGYLATVVIPSLRELIGDQDKINSLLNNLVYYVIGPALRTRTTQVDSYRIVWADPNCRKLAVILDQICAMSHMPFTYRTWRKEVWDVFLDNRFFYISFGIAKKWQTIVQAMMPMNKERFTEVVGRITTTPTSTFFSNKDQETQHRAQSVRRLSFVLFCGTVDQYVLQFPVIQEKIVELLKLDHHEAVHAEIYLCLRVMLIRFSPRHLQNFWPVLITEMMRLFEVFLQDQHHDRPEEAQIALAGCKFLDLLCTLDSDAFQIYQWIFIRDTVEHVIHSMPEGPTPIMELLSEKWSQAPNTMESFGGTSADSVGNNASLTSSAPSAGELKRPMLTMHSIGSLKQLLFFVEHVSLYVYQSSFTLAKPDMPFIESLILKDFLEGDIDSD